MKYSHYRHHVGALSLAAVLGLTWTAGAAAEEAPGQNSVKVTISESGNSAAGTTEENATSIRQADPEEAEVSKVRAIEKLRKVMPILKEAEVDRTGLTYETNTPYSGEPLVWDVHWSYHKDNVTHGFSSTVNAKTGDIIQASLYSPLLKQNESYYPPELSKEEAAAKAEEIIETAAPSVDTDQLKLENSPGSSSESLFGNVGYSMNFVPYIDGVPVSNQSINIEMSGSGDLTRFANQIGSADYPDAEPEISKEEAETVFYENMNLQLSYFSVDKGSGEEEVFLGWAPDPNKTSAYLDASGGRFLNSEGKALDVENVEYEELDAPSTFEPVQTGENGRISKEQAVEVIQKYKDTNGAPDNASLRDNALNYDHTIWELTWQQQTAQGGALRAEVDASTGQVLSIIQFSSATGNSSSGSQNEDNSSTDSREALKETAFETLAGLYPDAADHFKYAENANSAVMSTDDQPTFVFQRFAGDIPVRNDRVYITLDQEGELIQYQTSITTDLEEKIKGLSDETGKEEAKTAFKEELRAKLQYQQFPVGTVPASEDKEMKLIYQQQLGDNTPGGRVIDAQTGEWRSSVRSSYDQNRSTQPAQDINGHEAEDALQTLLQYSVLSTDAQGNVKPDATITYGDWLEMASRAVSPDYDRVTTNRDQKPVKNIDPEHEYYEAVQYADDREWLDEDAKEIDTGAVLTKEQFIQSAIRILGYDQFATHMDETPAFEDAGAIADKGAVNAAIQLGLVDENADAFAPDQEITRADAALLMMKMVNLQDSIDQTITDDRFR